MEPWILYSVIGMFQVSLQMALFKIPAAKQIDKYQLSTLAFLFASILAGISLFNSISFDPKTVLYAFLWGSCYAILALMQMHILHKRETGGVFPFTSLASNVLVVFGGILFLNEYISHLQWLAIILSALVFIGSYYSNKLHFTGGVLPFFILIALLSTVNKFIQKFGSVNTEIHNFIFWQLVFAFITSLLIFIYTKKDRLIFAKLSSDILLWALLLGVLNLGTNFMVVKALSTGPISLVYTILGLYTFFTSIIAAIFFKEKITARSLSMILISFLIILLIKFG